MQAVEIIDQVEYILLNVEGWWLYVEDRFFTDFPARYVI